MDIRETKDVVKLGYRLTPLDGDRVNLPPPEIILWSCSCQIWWLYIRCTDNLEIDDVEILCAHQFGLTQ